MGMQLLVYLHTTMKQRPLQKLLEAELPGFGITTVGRSRDFLRALKDRPDAVLTLPEVLRAYDLEPVLRGAHRGTHKEPYGLVSREDFPQDQRPKKVGVVGLLDRKGTKAFLAKLLGEAVRPVRVTKVEDLLPLLQMRMAESVLLPVRQFPYIQNASRLDLRLDELEVKVELPALSVQGGDGQAIERAIKGLSGEINELLGVDSWS